MKFRREPGLQSELACLAFGVYFAVSPWGVNTLMTVVLVQSIGALGDAFSSSVGMILCNVFLLFRVREKIGIIPTVASFERVFRR